MVGPLREGGGGVRINKAKKELKEKSFKIIQNIEKIVFFYCVWIDCFILLIDWLIDSGNRVAGQTTEYVNRMITKYS